MSPNIELAVGPVVPAREVVFPPHEPIMGKHVSLVPLVMSHVPALYKHLGGEGNFWRWTYMFIAGWSNVEACKETIAGWIAAKDPQFYAVVLRGSCEPAGREYDVDSEAVGLMSFLSIVPSHRRIEIGSIILSDAVLRSRAATEAFSLTLGRAFDLGYSRVEWKANALNAKSLKSARRLGFTYEGLFR